jgi:RNA 2',3'-cyclic 3'-phosphodiesterase
MRLYIGINLPTDLKQSLAMHQSKLKELGLEGSWKAPEYLHITLEFLGELPIESIPVLSDILNKVAANNEAFELNLDKLGAFPSFDKPHTIWTGVDGQVDIMAKLWNDIHTELEKNGFVLQKNPFNPHITLLSRPKKIPESLRTIPIEKKIGFTVSEIIIFESKVEDGKRIYPHLFKAKLKL